MSGVVADDSFDVCEVLFIQLEVRVHLQGLQDVFSAVAVVNLDHKHLFGRDLNVDLILQVLVLVYASVGPELVI